MREILFRGKRTNSVNKSWVFGNLIIYDDGSTDIATPCSPDMLNKYYVDEDTVGQFTGLYDKNGNKIFEGDIVSIKTKNVPTIAEVVWSVFYGVLYEIIENGDKEFQGVRCRREDFCISDYDFYDKYVEVIGNIYDNTEFL